MAFIAGLCWIFHYALQVGYGLATGKVLFEAEGTYFFQVDMLVFYAAYLGMGLALFAFALGLPSNLRVLKAVAIAFAFVGALAGLAGMLLGVPFAGKAILAHFVAALLVGFGAWGAPEKNERIAARCIALFGLLTMPLAMLFGTLEQTVPSYFVTEAHFVFSGFLWLAAARAIAVKNETV